MRMLHDLAVWVLGAVAGLVVMASLEPVVARTTGDPSLKISYTPRVAVSPAIFYFRAELHGREEERLYCPAVEWTWADGTRSLHEEDCPPWDQHTEEDYKRLWTQRKALGFGRHLVEVRLLRSGKVLMRASVEPIVLGE